MVLTKDSLEGAYAFVPMPWDEQGNLDEQTLEHDVSYLADSEIDGLFAFDSTGEFFTIELDEYREAVDIIVEASGDTPIQINCTWPNQTGALERAAYAGTQGADAVRFAFPFWEKLTVEEALEFSERLAAAADPAPLVHYNIPRAKRMFGADEYKRLVERVPSVIGTKLATDERTIREILAEVPELNHFVGEPHFVSMMGAGANGSYSWLGTMNPAIMSEWYEAAAAGDWNRSMEIQQDVWEYGRMRLDSFDVHTDAGYNKIDAAVNPNLECGVGVREPYRSATPEDPKRARDWAEKHTPELVEY
ncbi:dihydrodipicolinate synthase family protein [Halovenus marina]|uniref:dihydrodipicolinate synthase family protein n=1 Tax=Halovenus marina TaxID=3396621 RepID=UPI003F547D2C